MKKYLLLAGIVGGLSLAAIAWAEPGDRGEGSQGRGDGPKGPGGGFGALVRNDELAKELGVTDEQRTALREAMHQHQKDMIKLRSDSDLAKLEVRRLLDADNPDTEAVMKALDESIRLDGELRKARTRQMLQVRGLVGPETAQKLKAYMRAHREDRGRGQGFGPGRDRGPGKERGGDQRSDDDSRDPPWKQDRMPPPDEE